MLERGSGSWDTSAPFTSCCSSGPKQRSSSPWAHVPQLCSGCCHQDWPKSRAQPAADWQHHPPRALSELLHGFWWLQSLEKPWLSTGWIPLLPGRASGASAPSCTPFYTICSAVACLPVLATPTPQGLLLWRGKLGSHCCRSCQPLSLQLGAPGSSLSSS